MKPKAHAAAAAAGDAINKGAYATGQDVYDAIHYGGDATGGTSGIVCAGDPEATLASIPDRVIAVLASVVLAVSLCPMPSWADEVEKAAADQDGLLQVRREVRE